MSRFVLVHGAFAGAWIWGPLMDRLKAAGHAVEAFDLPGLGDDHTPVSQITLDSCAARLCEVLAKSSEPAIVVGNSMGGIIATQGAARCPSRVAAIVYVAAFVPKDGQSLLDLTKLPEGAGDQVQANIVIEGEPPVAIMATEASRQALYGSCTEEAAAWAIAKQRPQPVAPFATPVSISPGALDGIRRYYVLTKRDRAIPPALQRRMIAENPFAGVVEFDTDHTPQLSMTDELTQALLKLTSDVEYLNPPALSTPTGYTHVVPVHRGRTIYIAGQVAFDTSGNVVGKGDFAAQTTQVFENLKSALAAAGATFDNLVKVTTFVTDLSQMQTLRTIRAKYYGKNAPASTLVQITQLANADLMIEIEAIAVVPE